MIWGYSSAQPINRFSFDLQNFLFRFFLQRGKWEKTASEMKWDLFKKHYQSSGGFCWLVNTECPSLNDNWKDSTCPVKANGQPRYFQNTMSMMIKVRKVSLVKISAFSSIPKSLSTAANSQHFDWSKWNRGQRGNPNQPTLVFFPTRPPNYLQTRILNSI